jgi:hypothetical protein
MTTPQTQWPETIGLQYEEAVARIKKTFTGHIASRFPGMACTAVYMPDRVIVNIGRDGRVIAPAPKLG